jgi:hypothetical protein
MARNKPALPSNRAFVVQFRGDAEVEHGECRGRVEHIVSAQAGHFTSVEELMAVIASILAMQPRDED